MQYFLMKKVHTNTWPLFLLKACNYVPVNDPHLTCSKVDALGLEAIFQLQIKDIYISIEQHCRPPLIHN